MSMRHKLYQRGVRGTWWVDFGLIGGVRHKRTTGELDRVRAEAVAASFAAELERHHIAQRVKKLTMLPAGAEWGAVLQEPAVRVALLRLWRNARSRARASQLTWALGVDDFWRLVAASNGLCAVTAMPFCITSESRYPFKASIDRLDNSTGYSIGNCRLVLMAVNYAMNVWGEDLFRAVALSYAANSLRDQVQIRNLKFHNQEDAPKLLIQWGG